MGPRPNFTPLGLNPKSFPGGPYGQDFLMEQNRHGHLLFCMLGIYLPWPIQPVAYSPSVQGFEEGRTAGDTGLISKILHHLHKPATKGNRQATKGIGKGQGSAPRGNRVPQKNRRTWARAQIRPQIWHWFQNRDLFPSRSNSGRSP